MALQTDKTSLTPQLMMWATRRRIACGFRGMAIRVPKLLSITIPKWRVPDGVTDLRGGFRKRHASARNGISQIAEILNKNNWLPTQNSNPKTALGQPRKVDPA